ncbi:M81 family metallopeptidase [Pyruvatibacter sp. HU-CL02332]|uniref:M81 family metallopeptidase n=1 Tax=Pyruvatibacter sp. HU-CL02332 TaxID=3127650 RepID=UPI003102768A
MRVAVGGFQHETNTFAPQKADLDAFLQPDAWPALQGGPGLLTTFAPGADGGSDMNIPIAGFLAEAPAQALTPVPMVWAAATPSAHVTSDAFAHIAGMMVEELERALRDGPLDAIYLDLHGAMVTEEMEDGEGDLLEWIRDITNGQIPIVASLDLHANVTAKMMRNSDALVAYRTYPHVDMAETGARAAKLVANLARRAGRPAKAFRKLNYLIPLTAQSTMSDPAALIYADVTALERLKLDSGGSDESEILTASATMGFPPADIAECGPAVMAYADTQEAADEAVDRLAETFMEFERGFRQKIWTAEEAVAYGEAASDLDRRDGPLILADTQDNPGAGGNGDTVGILRSLISGAETALCGVLFDPAAANTAWAAGEGADVQLSLGAWTGGAREKPIEGKFKVLKLHDGEIDAHGPFYRGAHLSLGKSALLMIEDVRVVVASHKVQTADRAMFTAFGVEPAAENIVAVKSSVHFRADFQKIARDIVVVGSPGPNPADHVDLPYRRLRSGVRLMPMGPAFQRSRKPLK